jgi:hypothetical protein
MGGAVPYLPISDGKGTLIDQESEGIAPFMAHPINEDGRERFNAIMRARTLLPVLRASPQNRLVALRAGELRALIELALAGRPETMDYRLGELASDILVFNLVCAKDHPQLVGVKRCIFALSTAKMSERSLMTRWTVYRSVAHLWAAVWLWNGSSPWYSKDDIDVTWVKDQSARLQFLAMAEQLRLMGENTFAHGQRSRSQPILNPSETWKVPPDLILPAVTVKFQPIPAPLLARLKKYRPNAR